MSRQPFHRCAARVLAACALFALATTSHALTFTYNWSGTGSTGGGTSGTGFMTFDANVPDPANFSGLTLANVVDFAYEWNNGSGVRSITESNLAFANNTISAVNGALSNFVMSDFPFNSFSISVAPSTLSVVGISENSNVTPFTDRDQGAWRLAPVPEPGTLAMMLAGLGGLAAVARRRLLK